VLLLLLLLCGLLQPADAVILNTVRFWTNFPRLAPLFEDYALAAPVATTLLLSAIGAAQYGYLPVRTRTIVRKLERMQQRWPALWGRSGRFRRDTHPGTDNLHRLLTVLEAVEGDAVRYSRQF